MYRTKATWRRAAHAVSTLSAVVLIGEGVAAAPTAAPTQSLSLVTLADIPLGGHTTRLDYESLDAGRHLLFIAQFGDSAVVAFDTQTQRVVARIEGVSKAHGVLVIPELGRVFASAIGTNEVVAIDERTFKVMARIPGGVYADGMAYAPDVRKLYVSDEDGDTDTVIDVRTNTRVATIPLGGEVGNTQYGPVGGEFPIKRPSESETDHDNGAARRSDQATPEPGQMRRRVA